MDRCPLEVVGNILSHADILTLKALRLVDRTISHLATPFLFREVYLGYLQSSFTKLRQISRSRLAKHVRSMVYIIDILPDLKDQDTWWVRVSSPDDLRIDRATLPPCRYDGAKKSQIEKTEAEKAKCWGLYQHYYLEQLYLLYHNVDQTMLAAAFTHLRNFEKIEIRTTHTLKAGEKWMICHPFWTRLLNETLYPPGYLDTRDSDRSLGGRLCKNVLMALSWNTVRLKQIDTWMVGGTRGILARPQCVPWSFMAAAFIYVKKLNLELQYRTEFRPDRSETSPRMLEAASHMAQWLHAANRLEILRVSFLDDFDIDEEQPDTMKVLALIQWPKLRSLDLSHFHTTEDTLFSLTSGQPALEHLALSCINLNLHGDPAISGLWVSFFRRLSATKGPSLKSVSFSALVDEQHQCMSLLPRNNTVHERLQDYIRFGGEFPDLSGVEEREPVNLHGSLSFGYHCDFCGEPSINDFGTCAAQGIPPLLPIPGSPVWIPTDSGGRFT